MINHGGLNTSSNLVLTTKKDKYVDKSAPHIFKYAGNVQIPDVAYLFPFNNSSELGVECLRVCLIARWRNGNAHSTRVMQTRL